MRGRAPLAAVVASLALVTTTACGGGGGGGGVASGPALSPPPRTLLSEAPPRAALAAFTDQLDQLVPGLLAASPASGVAVAVVRGGRTAWSAGYGVADRSSGAPVTATTRFNAASVTKPLTAWAVLALVEDGRLHLDAPVGPLLSRWRIPASAFDADRVTARRLLSHTAGFPAYQCLDATREPTPESCLAGAGPGQPLRLTAAPGSSFAYTNAGFIVAQLLVEEAARRPFPEFVRDRVLRPLGMGDSDVDWGEGGPLATPYQGATPLGYVPRSDQGAAGLTTTASDLARFVAALGTSDGRPAGRGALSPASVALTLDPAPGTVANRDQDRRASYGLGLALERIGDGILLATHKGNNPGWTALIAALPERGEGLVVLSNGEQARALTTEILCRWSAWSARALPQRCGGPYVLGG